MYNLGDQFNNTKISSLVSLEEASFHGKNYRITVLTERLVRLEYSRDGMFNNYETPIIKNRHFDMPDFNKNEDEHILNIETRYFSLTYYKNTAFSSRTLFASCNGKKYGWYYGQKEVRNVKSTAMSLDNRTSLPELEKGLFSLEGIATIDDSNSMRLDEKRNIVPSKNLFGYIDLYLFIYGKDFGLCIKDYFHLTGSPKMIPRYALGNWWSKECDYTDKEILEKIDKFKMRNIPLSVFVLDNGWSKKDKDYPKINNSFSFNKELIPKPNDFINEVHKKGIKIGLKINPQYGFYPFEDNFEIAKKYLALNKNGYIDFNPNDMKCMDVFFKVFLHPLESTGIDLIWNDYFDVDKNKQYLVNYYMDLNLLKDNKRGLVLSRNSTYDAHTFNILYSGRNVVDWNTLKMLPFYNLNSANIGISWWSHDVGGSVGGIEDSDFYLRSLQFGVFSPILRFNTVKGNYYKREPWKWDVVTNSIASDYLRLRHKLIPYIYSEAYKYTKDGNALIQPFYYYNINFYYDENYVNQYYFGDSFMISPIIKPLDEVFNRTIQRMYIPDGVWYDFKTGKRFLGNHKYISFYTIDDYPIFVKQGSIIPMAGENSFMSCDNPQDLEIHVFPGNSNTYRLYEDDGITRDYLQGKYSITEIDYNYRKSNYTIVIRPVEGDIGVIPNVRDYKIVFRNTKKADNVVVYDNDKLVENVKTEVTETDFIVSIKNISTKDQLSINCYGKDIEIDSIKLVKDDIDSILYDLKINTALKDDVASIVFDDNLTLAKKRISIRRLKRKGLDPRSVKAFLRLLDYMEL